MTNPDMISAYSIRAGHAVSDDGVRDESAGSGTNADLR